MKTLTLLLSLLAPVEPLIAALPPEYQNEKDLDAMVAYIKHHPKVAATLKSIDLLEYSIYFGNECRAQFHRKPLNKPKGWVGPASPLEFKSTNCPGD